MSSGEEIVPTKREVKDCKRCEKWRDQITKTSPLVQFLISHVALLPPPPLSPDSPLLTSPSPSSSGSSSSSSSTLSDPASSSSSNSNEEQPGYISPSLFQKNPFPTPNLPIQIHCITCPPQLQIAGGYFPSLPGIAICSNRIMNKRHLEDSLSHELIHAFDDRRFDVGWGKGGEKGLRGHACSEVRAANLSGDCRWSREFGRLIFGFTGQREVCAKRRAILAVRANPECQGPEHAERVVGEVFDSCFKDTRPFDEIYPS